MVTEGDASTPTSAGGAGVECFQRAYNAAGHSISVDGIVGPQTWAALGNYILHSQLNLGTWTYFYGTSNNSTQDFRMWGASPWKWYVHAGGCWRQMDENSSSCE